MQLQPLSPTSFAVQLLPLSVTVAVKEIFFVVFRSFQRHDGLYECSDFQRCETVMKDENPLKCRTHPSKYKFIEVGLFFLSKFYT